MGNGRRGFAVTVAAALVAMTAACTSGGSGAAGGGPTTTASTAGPTTTTLDPTRAAILAAYRAGWADVIAVGTRYPINPLDPRLALHTTGKQLLSEQQALTRINLNAHYEMGSLDLNPIVTSVSGDSATIMECDFDHSVEIDAHTGKAVDKPDVGHTLLRFTMTRINGEWFVSDSTTLASGKTINACTPSAY